MAAGNVDQVRRHRAGGWPVARAGALEQQPTGEVAFGDHRVGRSFDRGQRMMERDETRLDALEQFARPAGLVAADPATLVRLGVLDHRAAFLLLGIIVAVVLLRRHNPFAFLAAIFTTTALA